MSDPLSAAALAHIQAARDGRLDQRIPKRLLDDLRALADERGISRSTLVVEMLARSVAP